VKNNLLNITGDLAQHIDNNIKAKESLYVGLPKKDYSHDPRDGITQFTDPRSNLIGLFDNYNNSTNSIDFLSIKDIEEKTNKYDFVVADLPWGLKSVPWNKKYKIKGEYVHIINLMSMISKNGYGLFYVPPFHWFFSTVGSKNLVEIFSENNIYLNAIINPPEEILQPVSSIRPIILLLSHNKCKKLFLGELLESNNSQEIVENYFNSQTSNNLEEGLYINQDEFIGFDHLRFNKEIDNLKTSYKEYQQYKMDDITKEISLPFDPQGNFDEKNNSIYFPRIGKSKVHWNLENTTLKHHNYFQIVLDESIVINKYAALFFSSDLGKNIRKSLFVGNTIKNITQTTLKTAGVIAIPPLEEQKLIIETHEKLIRLEREVELLSNELSLNPKKAGLLQEKIDDTLQELSTFTGSDKVMSFIRQGESITREFKSTLRFNVRSKKYDNEMTFSVLKTINGMINTKGGILLIGVEDNGNIYGIKDDGFKNNDEYLRFLYQQIINSMSKDISSNIKTEIIDVENKSVCLVEIPTRKKVWLKWKEQGKIVEKFFIRTGPRTDELLPSEVDKYIQENN